MKETQPKKQEQTIVEIGANYPIYKMFKGNESLHKIKEGAPYIAVNYNEEDLKTVKENKLGQAIVGDIKELPLSNNSADQIWLMNVFSDFQNIPKKQPDGREITTMGVDDVFKELVRVVKPGGKIIIGEVYPPITETKWLPDWNYARFGLKKEVHRGAKEVEKFIEEMGGKDYFEFTIKDFKNFNFEPFFLVLEKEPETPN